VQRLSNSRWTIGAVERGAWLSQKREAGEGGELDAICKQCVYWGMFVNRRLTAGMREFRSQSPQKALPNENHFTLPPEDRA
jgi:hypothetical protein